MPLDAEVHLLILDSMPSLLDLPPEVRVMIYTYMVEAWWIEHGDFFTAYYLPNQSGLAARVLCRHRCWLPTRSHILDSHVFHDHRRETCDPDWYREGRSDPDYEYSNARLTKKIRKWGQSSIVLVSGPRSLLRLSSVHSLLRAEARPIIYNNLKVELKHRFDAAVCYDYESAYHIRGNAVSYRMNARFFKRIPLILPDQLRNPASVLDSVLRQRIPSHGLPFLRILYIYNAHAPEFACLTTQMVKIANSLTGLEELVVTTNSPHIWYMTDRLALAVTTSAIMRLKALRPRIKLHLEANREWTLDNWGHPIHTSRLVNAWPSAGECRKCHIAALCVPEITAWRASIASERAKHGLREEARQRDALPALLAESLPLR